MVFTWWCKLYHPNGHPAAMNCLFYAEASCLIFLNAFELQVKIKWSINSSGCMVVTMKSVREYEDSFILIADIFSKFTTTFDIILPYEGKMFIVSWFMKKLERFEFGSWTKSKWWSYDQEFVNDCMIFEGY